MRNKKNAVLLAVALACCIIPVKLILTPEKTHASENKVVILGFDGLSPLIVEPMMKEGKLRNFLRLAEKGSYKRLSTTNPSQSPVAWSGFATGQNPGKNGIFDFIRRDPANYALSLSLCDIKNGRPRRVLGSKCFWQYTSEKKVPTTIITCPVTFPPDKIYGKMLSGMGVPDILGTEGTFTFYTSEHPKKSGHIGGKVFFVRKSPLMKMQLIGPKIANLAGKVEHAKVPFTAALKDDKTLLIEYQNRKCLLKPGQWSGWMGVDFNVGFFRKVEGIFKFYLVETDPEFKLYVSPINFDPRASLFRISYPGSYARDLAERIGLYYTQGMPMDTWAVNEQRIPESAFLKQVNEVLREKKAMLDLELHRLKKGVLFCYFESPDIIQHMFWRYTDPLHPLYEPDDTQGYREIIPEWYRKMDVILGEVMDTLGPKDVLIVLSDHGFDSFRRAVHLNTWLRKNGYLKLKDPDAVSGGELLGDIDWSGTKAYSIGFGAIYINQARREKNGIVPQGKETDKLKQEISDGLKAWRDEKYGNAVVNNVYESKDIFHGKHAELTPDLYVGFNIGYRASWQTALGGVPETLIEDNMKKWSGSHLFDPALIPGIIFTNVKITREDPSIYDVAPTILKIVGFDKKELRKLEMDGKPLF